METINKISSDVIEVTDTQVVVSKFKKEQLEIRKQYLEADLIRVNNLLKEFDK